MIARLLARAGAALAAALALPLLTAAPSLAHPPSDVERAEGSYQVAVDETPRGVTADVLHGRVPGFFVQVPAGHTLVVRDAADRLLARIGSTAAAAQGTWLDKRLRLPREPSPEHHPKLIRSWRIPATLDGKPVEFAGTVTWIPTKVPDAVQAQRTESHQHDDSDPDLTVIAVAAAGVLAAGAAAWWFRSRRRRA
jgi:hypothetical protein